MYATEKETRGTVHRCFYDLPHCREGRHGRHPPPPGGRRRREHPASAGRPRPAPVGPPSANGGGVARSTAAAAAGGEAPAAAAAAVGLHAAINQLRHRATHQPPPREERGRETEPTRASPGPDNKTRVATKTPTFKIGQQRAATTDSDRGQRSSRATLIQGNAHPGQRSSRATLIQGNAGPVQVSSRATLVRCKSCPVEVWSRASPVQGKSRPGQRWSGTSLTRSMSHLQRSCRSSHRI